MTESTRIGLIVAAVAIVTYGASAGLMGVGLVDDTYIFVRYAENFAAGEGLVFNPGERVEGYTSPLWVALLGLIGTVSDVDLVALSGWLSALFGVLTIVAVVWFGARVLPPDRTILIAAPALFLATSPSFVYWTWSGMGTGLFTFLFLITFAVFARQVDGPGTMFGAGVCLLLAALSRLEIVGLLVVYTPFIFYLSGSDRRAAARKCASFVAPVALLAIHFVWRYNYYDSLLPNTYYAKVDVPLLSLLNNGLRYGARFALAYHWLVISALVSVPVVWLARKKTSKEWQLATAVVAAWAVYVTYVGGDHFSLFRFYAPILPVLSLVFMGLIAWLPIESVKSAAPATAAAVLVVLQVGLNYAVFAFHGGNEAREGVELAESWSEVGLWLKNNVPPGSTIASLVVGAIPYRSELVTIDLLGLTDREVARNGNVYAAGYPGHQRYHTEYILGRRPDYIVYHSSGRFTEPRNEDSASIPKPFGYALYDLANNPRTKELYEYRALRMENGRFVELLQLRE